MSNIAYWTILAVCAVVTIYGKQCVCFCVWSLPSRKVVISSLTSKWSYVNQPFINTELTRKRLTLRQTSTETNTDNLSQHSLTDKGGDSDTLKSLNVQGTGAQTVRHNHLVGAFHQFIPTNINTDEFECYQRPRQPVTSRRDGGNVNVNLFRCSRHFIGHPYQEALSSLYDRSLSPFLDANG